MKTKMLLLALLTYTLAGCTVIPMTPEQKAAEQAAIDRASKNIGSNRTWCQMKPNDYRCAK